MGMLDSLKEMATDAALTLAQRMAPPDLSAFNDPLALQTTWTALTTSSSNIRTYSLEALDERRLAFKPTLFRHGLWLSVIATGVVVAVAAWPRPIGVGLGAVVAALGCAFLFRPKRRVFDGQQAQCEGVGDKPTLAFSEIHAVQLLSRWVGNDNGSYETNELNLVLRDATRIHVQADPNLAKARDAAMRLSALMGCRFWDATSVPKVQFSSLEDVKKFAEASAASTDKLPGR